MKHIPAICLTLVWALLAAAIPALAADAPIGTVKTVQGDVVVVRGDGTHPCQEGMHVFTGDTLQSKEGGRAGVILLDGTRLALGEKAQLKIDKFLYAPSESSFGLVLQIVRGIVIYTSGKIAKFSPASVEIRTPVGIAGTRGTALAMRIEAQ